jgi:hypothetical protein
MTLNVSAGVPAVNARSYAYDNSNYIQCDPVNFAIAATASSSFKMTAFTKKQLKSITLVPTIAPGANDQLTLTLVSLAAQTFGTATGVSYVPALTGTLGTSTSTATSSNTITIGPLQTFGTNPAFNPAYMGISGGTYTVVVANGSGTNTQTGYVFPTGPNGGLTVNPGDVLTVAKGTDTAGAYQCEAEMYFTPGTSLTI